MISREDNELLTRVGPATPMGAVLREYWLPVLHSVDLPARDGAPVRTRLLGEDLIAFRDTTGRIGLFGQACPHRGASLFFARNEEEGLRCVYHGWKFDVEGRCLDIPNEPATEAFRSRVRATAYPCREQNGIVWTYMGPLQEPPALPELPWALASENRRGALKYQRECNWLQALEGDFDSSHLTFLHSRRDAAKTGLAAPPGDETEALRNVSTMDRRPSLEIVETAVGIAYGARRPADAERDYVRVTEFLLPFYTSVAGYGGRNRAKAWVPLDDEHTMVWEPNWSESRDLTPEERRGWDGRVPSSGFLPDDGTGLGRGRFAANGSNDYGIDRSRQKTSNFSGIEDSPPLQDGAIQESMGPIVDRTKEHLGAADAAVVAVRRALLETVRAHRDRGEAPRGSRSPSLYRRFGRQIVLSNGDDWRPRLEAETPRSGARS